MFASILHVNVQFCYKIRISVWHGLNAMENPAADTNNDSKISPKPNRFVVLLVFGFQSFGQCVRVDRIGSARR